VKPAVIHSEARAELDAAILFYESRAKGLGLDLQTKVEQAVRAIQRSPESWPPHKHSGFRKYFVERFPFTIFYFDMPDTIWIAAIAHASRRPGNWTDRRIE
jgi:toxin ParE1/3/4